jgi:hypothetical protein
MVISALAAALVLGQGYADDPRLRRPIGTRYEGVTMAEACKELTIATGVALSAAEEIAEDYIVLRVKSRPAEEVMRVIAEHFLLEWKKDGGGYKLTSGQRFKSAADETFAAGVMVSFDGLRETARSWANADEVHHAKEPHLLAAMSTVNAFGPEHWLRWRAGGLMLSTLPERSRLPLPAAAREPIRRSVELLSAPSSGFTKSPIRPEDVHAVDIVFPGPDQIQVYYLDKSGRVLAFFHSNLAYGRSSPPTSALNLNVVQLSSSERSSLATSLPLLGSKFSELVATDADLISDLYDQYVEDRSFAIAKIEDGWAKVRAWNWGFWRARTLSRALMLKICALREEKGGLTVRDVARFAEDLPKGALWPTERSALDRLLQFEMPLSNPWWQVWAGLTDEQRSRFKTGGTVRLNEVSPKVIDALLRCGLTYFGGDCGDVEDFMREPPFLLYRPTSNPAPWPTREDLVRNGSLTGVWAEVEGTRGFGTPVIQEGVLIHLSWPQGAAEGRLRVTRPTAKG